MKGDNMVQQRFLSESDVALLLGMSVKTLQKHRHESRGLPYVKIGRAVRYDVQAVESWINQKRVEPAD